MVVAFLACSVGSVSAQQSSSTNYSVDETNFSSGTQQDMCSDEYCGDATAGDLTVGEAKSDSFRAQFGSHTTNDPLLEVIVIQSDQDMGILSTDVTGFVSAEIAVRNYLSNGYTMQITGLTPHNGNHYVTPMNLAADSVQGTEQFGINMVNNSSPDIGADPVQVPDSEFSFGMAAQYYNEPNKFKYFDGDIIAQSLVSSGQTNYTMSMIMNVSNTTPGGKYAGQFSAVVTPIY